MLESTARPRNFQYLYDGLSGRQSFNCGGLLNKQAEGTSGKPSRYDDRTHVQKPKISAISTNSHIIVGKVAAISRPDNVGRIEMP